jgi:hypothetical protein
VTLAQIDLTDMVAGNAAFSSDRTHQVTGFYSVARADSHEQLRHASSIAAVAINWPRPSGGKWIFGRHPTLRALALEKMEGGCSELGCVELFEERLQRNDFSRGNTAGQYPAELLTHGFLTVVRASLRTVKIHRRQASARQLP